MASEKTMEDLDLTRDEVKRLGDALKDEKFRKMLVEYAEEISDPENKRKAEEEIRMMENERGMNVQFIHPKPGHVLKTTVDGTTKVFINICQNDKIDKPSSKRETGPDGKYGLMWHIPHSFAPPRDDVDKAKGKCRVFDVVFHPDTYRMATNNVRFKKLVEDTAMEGIERQFSVTLDKQNVKLPKMTFKGQPVATVIREHRDSTNDVKQDPDSILSKMPYPYDNKSSSEKAKMREAQTKSKSSEKNGLSDNKKVENKDESKFTVPKYTVTHRSNLDMSEYRNAPDAKTSTRPNELVIKIELPLLKSATELNLDIFVRKIVLESSVPAAYKLDLDLPFPVNDDEGSAKFDKSKRCLTVTLPVIPDEVPVMPFSHRGDGDNIESQNGNKTESSPSDLITVIQDTPNAETKEQSPKLHELNVIKNSESGHKVPESNGEIKLPQHVKWLIPEYQVSQDAETVSFVIKVCSVQEKSISMNFTEDLGVKIDFMSLGAGCFPSYYRMMVQFGEKCKISPKHCSVDVSDDNLVLLILKDKSCREPWDSYSVGMDNDSLEAKQFLTECNLKRDLCALDEESEKDTGMPEEEEEFYDLSVLEMCAEKLTIEIKPKEKSEDEDKEEIESDPSSPSSIEVIHRKPTPPLHSILKHRTVSESSEDHSLGASTASIDWFDDDQSSDSNRRRTVSFNSRVDRASFKSNASVSSMAPTLKNKRKKQRRRDEKLKKTERRRRKLSGGEGTSSGEENLTRESWSDSHSVSEEDEGEEKETPFQRSISDPGPSVEKPESKEDSDPKEVNSQRKEDVNVIGISAESSEVIPNDSAVLDFRTKEKSEKNSNANVSVESQSAKNPSAENWNEKVTREITSKLVSGKNAEETNEGNDSDDDDDGVVGNVSVKENNDGVTADEVKKSDNEKSSENGEIKKEERSEVETMLSWEDGPRVNGTEHETKCAFQFSNTVMFDLDVD